MHYTLRDVYVFEIVRSVTEIYQNGGESGAAINFRRQLPAVVENNQIAVFVPPNILL